MRQLPNLVVLAALLAAAVTGSPAAPGATLVAIDSATDAPGAVELRFDPAPPDFAIAIAGGGHVQVRLGRCAAGAGLVVPPGWVLADDGDGLVLTSAAIARSIARVSRDGGSLRLVAVLQGPADSRGYTLGVGDVVSVAVYEDKSLSDDYTVGQDGNLNMPLIGAVPSVGVTETELSERIRSRLSEFLDAPNISVTIQAFRSQSVYVNVTGDAPRAVKIPLRPGMGLEDVLAEAGVALLPGQPIELRRSSGGADRSTTLLQPEDVEAAGAPRPADGDRIVVLEPRYVYIRGEVARAGRFIHRPGLTVQQLIALAGGLTEWASRKEIRVLRQTEDGTRDLDVDLRRIESGRAPDLELLPGDLVLLRRRTL